MMAWYNEVRHTLLALCLVGAVCGVIELILSWLDRRDVDRLSEEWRRRARERREERQ